MALNEISLVIDSEKDYESIPVEWCHNGVVGSGDMEVLMRKTESDGKVHVKIITPVTGYDDVWEMVIRKFVKESRLGDVSIQINDNNATPYVVVTRLRQGLLEAKAGESK